MFTALGHLVVRRRRVVLGVTGLFFVASVALGTGVFGVLKSGGFEDPGAESTEAGQLLEDRFGQGEPNVILLVTPASGTVADPGAAAAGAALQERLASSGVDDIVSYWSIGGEAVPGNPLAGREGDRALVLGRIPGEDEAVEEIVAEVSETFSGVVPGGAVSVEVGGEAEVFRQVGTTIEGDLAKAESIAVPITLVLLVLVFGTLVAALLPLFVGALAVFGTFLSLFAIAQVTDVSVFSINITTALGLGLAIDYSLFIVSRFREEMGGGSEPHDAVVRTVETAGRTVAFSALIVAISLSALLVFPMYFLRSFAYAGIAVVVVAATVSVLSLPALLAVLGRRVDAGRVPFLHRSTSTDGTGFWHRVATAVMRRPIPVATAVVALLLFLGAPFLGVEFGQPDDRVLPESASSRAVSSQLREEFDSQEANAFPVVAGAVDASDPAVEAHALRLSELEGVQRVDAASGRYAGGARLPVGTDPSQFGPADGGTGTWFNVVPAPGVEPVSPEGEALVTAVREAPAPFPVLVGGRSASLIDSKSALVGRLPLAGGIIVVVTFVLLFLMFGSLLVPVKAVVLNLLSLTATFGAMVWVFQDGNGSGLLDFTATGTLDITTPILMFCIAFGLSMDYEVFLLSRIKEEHDLTGDNTRSVAMGLERTGRIVTAAAALLSVTFLAFATSGVTIIKLFGLGLALAVVMDATIVRATLVPAFMRLAGEANWWAPAPLRRLHDRFGISEGGHVPPVVVDDRSVPGPLHEQERSAPSEHEQPGQEESRVVGAR
jgi:RND superfamily putative drug exporter